MASINVMPQWRTEDSNLGSARTLGRAKVLTPKIVALGPPYLNFMAAFGGPNHLIIFGLSGFYGRGGGGMPPTPQGSVPRCRALIPYTEARNP